jgi:hypothetical protein
MTAIWTYLLAHPAVLYYVAATLLAVLISRQTQVETWCASHPWANLLLQLPRRLGFDVWGLLAALQTLAESRAKVPPVVTENVDISGRVKTVVKTKITTLPEG